MSTKGLKNAGLRRSRSSGSDRIHASGGSSRNPVARMCVIAPASPACARRTAWLADGIDFLQRQDNADILPPHWTMGKGSGDRAGTSIDRALDGIEVAG